MELKGNSTYNLLRIPVRARLVGKDKLSSIKLQAASKWQRSKSSVAPALMKFLVIGVLMMLIMLMSISSIFAIGITPGRTNLDFAKGAEPEVEITVINTENKDMNVAFTVEGELKDYVSISNDIVEFALGESSKSLKYKIKMPAGLSPGLHTADIIAVDLPSGESVDTITTKVSVVSQLYVRVPYPGKYIDVKLDIVSKEDSNLVDFFIPIFSRGNEKIDSVSAVIDIYKGDEKVDSIETNKIGVEAGGRGELVGNWNPSAAPGSYKAVAKVDYDGKITEISEEFNFGAESLDVLGVTVNNFKLGEVARIQILVQNKLNDAISRAYANLKVFDSDLKEIENLKSEDYEIAPLENKEMVIYWFTEGLETGIYDSELKIDYDKDFISKNFKIDVTDDSMVFRGVGFVIAEQPSGKMNVMTVLYIVIGFSVLINVAWLLWWFRKRKKGKK